MHYVPRLEPLFDSHNSGFLVPSNLDRTLPIADLGGLEASMRVFVAVLALFALACQQTPRYKLETRSGQTLRVDTQTGETSRLEAGKWVAMPAAPEGTPTPQSSGLPDEALSRITVKATTTSSYGAHVTIDNGSDWDISRITLNINGESVSPTLYGAPGPEAGQRASYTVALTNPIQGKLYVEVMSAHGRPAH